MRRGGICLYQEGGGTLPGGPGGRPGDRPHQQGIPAEGGRGIHRAYGDPGRSHGDGGSPYHV